jgi:hypothetical protein
VCGEKIYKNSAQTRDAMHYTTGHTNLRIVKNDQSSWKKDTLILKGYINRVLGSSAAG